MDYDSLGKEMPEHKKKLIDTTVIGDVICIKNRLFRVISLIDVDRRVHSPMFRLSSFEFPHLIIETDFHMFMMFDFQYTRTPIIVDLPPVAQYSKTGEH